MPTFSNDGRKCDECEHERQLLMLSLGCEIERLLKELHDKELRILNQSGLIDALKEKLAWFYENFRLLEQLLDEEEG